MSYAATEASAAATRSHLWSMPSKSSQITPPLWTLSTLLVVLTWRLEALQAQEPMTTKSGVQREAEMLGVLSPVLLDFACELLRPCSLSLA